MRQRSLPPAACLGRKRPAELHSGGVGRGMHAACLAQDGAGEAARKQCVNELFADHAARDGGAAAGAAAELQHVQAQQQMVQHQQEQQYAQAHADALHLQQQQEALQQQQAALHNQQQQWRQERKGAGPPPHHGGRGSSHSADGSGGSTGAQPASSSESSSRTSHAQPVRAVPPFYGYEHTGQGLPEQFWGYPPGGSPQPPGYPKGWDPGVRSG